MHPFSLLITFAVLVVPPGPTYRTPAPSGSGVVSGVLVDEETSNALEGELVELRWIPPVSTHDYPYPWTPMDGSQRPRAVAQVSTDAEGRFAFEGLGRGLYQIQVELPLAGEQAVLDVAGEGSTHAVVTARLGRVAVGRVLRPDGSPAAGAEVFLAGVEDGQGGNALWEHEPMARAVRDDGTFLLPGLPEGRCWLEAWHDDLGFSAPAPMSEVGGVELVVRDEAGRLFPLDRARFGGVGISVSRDASGPYAASVREGGPAARAGLSVGDRIVAVDGLSTAWMPFTELLMRCRGPVGQPVALTLARGEQRSEVVIVREQIE